MQTNALRTFALLAAWLAFVVNPMYVAGCISSSTEDDPLRVAQAKARLLQDLDEVNGEGHWTFSEGGEQYELLLELTQAAGEDEQQGTSAASPPEPLMTVAHACGTHTFYQSASACGTSYQLAVAGTLTLRRLGDSPQTVASDVTVEGMLEDYGYLYVAVGDGGHLQLERPYEGTFEVRSFVATDLGTESLDVAFEAR